MNDEPSRCRFHPERPARFRCMKYGYDYCVECLESCEACTDPELYCRHRTQCMIWELCRKTVRKRKNRDSQETVGEATPR